MSGKVEKRCNLPAVYRYTWPGKDESYICPAHATQLLTIAQAMGLHIQLIPLTTDEFLAEHACSQMVRDET